MFHRLSPRGSKSTHSKSGYSNYNSNSHNALFAELSARPSVPTGTSGKIQVADLPNIMLIPTGRLDQKIAHYSSMAPVCKVIEQTSTGPIKTITQQLGKFFDNQLELLHLQKEVKIAKRKLKEAESYRDKHDYRDVSPTHQAKVEEYRKALGIVEAALKRTEEKFNAKPMETAEGYTAYLQEKYPTAPPS